MMPKKPGQAGFTLIELLIAMVVVAILGAIALPAYNNYILRGKVPEATSNLAAKRVKIEQFFQDNRTYVGAPVLTLDQGTSQYFDFSGVATATSYTLTAAGKASMTGFTYTVDQSNARASTVTGVSGWTGNTSCWVTKQGGQC